MYIIKESKKHRCYENVNRIFRKEKTPVLELVNICKKYKTGDFVQVALDHVSLSFRKSEFVAILGPSGSGKTTLLNIIGGLDRYDQGDVIINDVSTRKYKDKDWDSYRNHTIGFVFQSYNLIPHQTILANVELALTISGISKKERRKRAKYALKQVGLEHQEHKKPHQMSGGQMQRVAIARALVNNPDILLADEPTGALDSETSIQVMQLLKEVAQDRLVIMVTHNPELADAYATRIIQLKDGIICSDSHPLPLQDGHSRVTRHHNMGKSSMSFLTALSLSFHNLRTKKARTLLTSFAGSIGIIGIALIMALSNGVSNYIQLLEEETLSQYPLQIQSSGIDMSSMLIESDSDDSQNQEKNKIQVARMMTNMFSKIGSNDLASLKKYFDKHQDEIGKYINAIEYSYNIKPNIYSSQTDKVHQVHPDQSFSSLGLGSSASSNSLMSMVMSTDVFYQMPKEKKLYEDQYDVKAGRWPENYDECVVVLTSSGKISDFMLYTLGLRDYNELETMIRQFANEEEVSTPDNIASYSYDDILSVRFKLVNAVDYYVYDEQFQIYRDKSDDDAYMKNLIAQGEDLKIVGIIQPSEDANAAMLSTGIAYPSSLTEHIIDQAAQSEIVKAQLAHRDINVLTGKSFEDENDGQAYDMQQLISIDSDMLRSAFTFDQSQIQMDMDDIDFSQLQIDTSVLPTMDIDSLWDGLSLEITAEQIDKFYDAIYDDFEEYLEKNDIETADEESFRQYMQSQRAQELIVKEFSQVMQDMGITDQFIANLRKQLEIMIGQYSQRLSQSVQQQVAEILQKQYGQLADSMQDAFQFDSTVFAKAIKINMSENELSELMMSLMNTQKSTCDGNLALLQYADYDQPGAVSLYPKNFESKEQIIDILDKYNKDMEKTDKTKVISYTDYVGMLMSSVTDIIDIISYVLMAFVSISLVVSSIMIGVITYISVLERKKEIGILRAIGASKHNISEVFNAETFIIGLLAGVLGIAATLLLLIPGNMIIHQVAGNNDVNAVLPVTGAAVLVILSVVLTLLGGLIPSKLAAKKDPVTALRSE